MCAFEVTSPSNLKNCKMGWLGVYTYRSRIVDQGFFIFNPHVMSLAIYLGERVVPGNFREFGIFSQTADLKLGGAVFSFGFKHIKNQLLYGSFGSEVEPLMVSERCSKRMGIQYLSILMASKEKKESVQFDISYDDKRGCWVVYQKYHFQSEGSSFRKGVFRTSVFREKLNISEFFQKSSVEEIIFLNKLLIQSLEQSVLYKTQGSKDDFFIVCNFIQSMASLHYLQYQSNLNEDFHESGLMANQLQRLGESFHHLSERAKAAKSVEILILI